MEEVFKAPLGRLIGLHQFAHAIILQSRYKQKFLEVVCYMKSVAFLLLAIALSLGSISFAQEQDEGDPAKAEMVIRAAIKARGGDRYLSIRTVMSRGQHTPFLKGVSGDPSSFVDYIAYPDRERTEFGKGDRKYIQTNSGTSGWIYDGAQKIIRDQTEEQIRDFQQSIRHDIDNLLRNRWKEPGAKLVYMGRREAWKNTFSEAVRIDSADGSSVTLHFDSQTKLPMMSEYKSIREGGTSNTEVRYFRWVEFGQIMFPTFQDFYRDGQQTGRASFDEVSFNLDVPEKLFVKPSNIKEVK